MERAFSDGEDFHERYRNTLNSHRSHGYGSDTPSSRRVYYQQQAISYHSDINLEEGDSFLPRGRMWSFGGDRNYGNDRGQSGSVDFDAYVKEYRASRARGFVNNRLRRKATGSRKARVQLKKRIYVCTLCSSLDIVALHDYLEADFFAASTWSFFLVGDCLRLYKQTGGEMRKSNNGNNLPDHTNQRKKFEVEFMYGDEQYDNADLDKPSDVLETQEIFIFDFGACVFWGFSDGEEVPLLKLIRDHCKEGMVRDEDFGDGEDDMHYVIATRGRNYYDNDHEQYDIDKSNNSEYEGVNTNRIHGKVERIYIANDCVMLPENTNAKQRMAISYAIAQSSILKLMETQIENRMDEYEHIPLALAKGEPIRLSSTQLGKMIGEILLLRHEVNLHSDLLGIPDFLWEEDKYAAEYNLSRQYFEMELRLDIFNKRLNLLKQLVSVVNGQLINVHGKYRTEIIIATIFIYIIFLSIQQFSPLFFGIQLV